MTTVSDALAQAKAIQSRKDYNTLPKEVRDWCEWVIKTYDHKE